VSAVKAEDAENIPKFGINPVGIDGSYFELTMNPGDTSTVTVEFGNFGTVEGVADTYIANTYTLINGGLGIDLAAEPARGTSLWADYANESFALEAGMAQTRAIGVTVPTDASPGEYLTSIVIQDGASASAPIENDGVAFNTVSRQAIAIMITVPGPIVSGLSIGDVQHTTTGGNSVVRFAVENTGNARIKPAGEFVLTDTNGVEITRFAVTMESVFATDETFAEIPFSTLLNPGDYLVSLTLEDPARGVLDVATNRPLVVPAPVAPQTASAASEPNTAMANQQPIEAAAETAAVGDIEQSARSIPVMQIIGGAVLLVAAIGVVGFVITRRRSVIVVPPMVPVGTAPLPVMPVATVPSVSSAVTAVAIRQIVPPAPAGTLSMRSGACSRTPAFRSITTFSADRTSPSA